MCALLLSPVQSLDIVQQEVLSTKELPVIHTETKTITYEAAEVRLSTRNSAVDLIESVEIKALADSAVGD